VKIVRTNNSDFAAAAVEAMRRWLYRPATLNGTAVRQIVREHLGIALQMIAAPMGQPPQPVARRHADERSRCARPT
jgi:hypothetical protein